MIHRQTQLDLWLGEEEAAVRRVHPRALRMRTAKVLGLFWCLSESLVGYERVGWVGMYKEIV